MGDYEATSGTKPLIVRNTHRDIITVAAISDKGRHKSLETNELWWSHPDTGRVLRFDDGKLVSIADRGDWVEAVVDVEIENESDVGVEVDTNATAEIDGRPPEDHEADGAERANTESIIEELSALIAERNQKRPEGSYTTYLFEQGLEKIRKKTGEEAIELILANTNEEIVYESADLIYHMLVLFEAEGIPVAELFCELKKRRT